MKITVILTLEIDTYQESEYKVKYFFFNYLK